jgi:hypothetical protein
MDAVETCPDKCVFELAKDFVCPAEGFQSIEILKIITILGRGEAVIDAHGQDMMFYVRGTGSLIMDGVTMQNGRTTLATQSGAVYSASYSTVQFKNCQFRNNTNPAGTSAVFTSKNAFFVNCSFDSNHGVANSYLPPHGYLGGAAVYSASSSQFYSCQFRNNTSPFGPSAVNIKEYATLVNCSFDSNHGSSSAVYVGGGIFSNCTFDNNNNTNPYGLGGAVYSNKYLQGQFTNCRFTGNTAAQGGALLLGNGRPSVTNCTFDGNIATSGSGGAVLLANGGSGPPAPTPAAFVGCTFIKNIATAQGGHGGAVFAPANTVASFAGCNFVASALTTKGNNDIARFSTTAPRGFVEFICPANSTGASVMMKPDDLLVTQLPPQQQIVHCTP